MLEHLLLFVCVFSVNTLHVEEIGFDASKVVQEIDDMFVGITLDSINLHHPETLVPNLRNPKLIALTKELGPSYLRIGGTDGDVTTVDLKATKLHMTFDEGYTHYFIPHTIWDDINVFVRKTGLKLIWGLNVFERKNGKWDPTFTNALLDYSHLLGYQIAGFELGNEPNYFYRRNVTISAAQLGSDFKQLRHILKSGPYQHSLILGPDSAGFRAWRFLQDFLDNGGDVVDIATFHLYSTDGKTATLPEFTSVRKLDPLEPVLENHLKVTNRHHIPAWLGETSTAAGGGAVNLTDRYVAGFMWLDKLGISARTGLKGVMRQDIYGGHYGLLQKNMDPNPDYWLTLLYKRLVGNKVFDVRTSTHYIRVYAHCTKHNNVYNYKTGSVTVYAMNLLNDSVTFKFPHLHGQNRLDVYWLTPEHNDLQDQKVHLNGRTVSLTSDGKIPNLPPKIITSGSVTVPRQSFGYIVIPGASIAACKTGHGHVIGK